MRKVWAFFFTKKKKRKGMRSLAGNLATDATSTAQFREKPRDLDATRKAH